MKFVPSEEDDPRAIDDHDVAVLVALLDQSNDECDAYDILRGAFQRLHRQDREPRAIH